MNAELISNSYSIYINYMKNYCGFIEGEIMTKLKMLSKNQAGKNLSCNWR